MEDNTLPARPQLAPNVTKNTSPVESEQAPPLLTPFLYQANEQEIKIGKTRTRHGPYNPHAFFKVQG